MKLRSILLAASILAGVSSAHAIELSCDSPRAIIGDDKPGRDPIRSISVNYDTGNWRVVYTFGDGHTIDRANQYAVMDRSDNNPIWEGWHRKRSNLKMDGTIIRNGDNAYAYREQLIDTSKGVVLDWTADCRRIDFAPPPVIASAAPSPRDSMPVAIVHNAAYATLSVGNQTITALVDSGTTNLQVTESVANTLVSTGQAVEGPSVNTTIADGSTQSIRTIVITTVTLAGHEFHNIRAGVGPDDADMLLGFDVLRRVTGSFRIDAANSQLVFY